MFSLRHLINILGLKDTLDSSTAEKKLTKNTSIINLTETSSFRLEQVNPSVHLRLKYMFRSNYNLPPPTSQKCNSAQHDSLIKTEPLRKKKKSPPFST